MAGQIIRVLPRQPVSNTGSGAQSTTETVIAKDINVSAYTEMALLVRVHATVAVGTTMTLKVIIRSEAPCEEDCGQDFIYGTDIIAVSVANNTAAGTLLIGNPAVTGSFGSHVRVILQYGTGLGGSSGTISGTISADLVLKV